MNILPMVLTFIFIFSFIATTLMREHKSYSLIETTRSGYQRTERQVNSAIVRKAYLKDTYKKGDQKESEPTKKAQGYVSKRTLFPPSDNTKFNLTALIKYDGELKLHPLYEPLAEFLRLLYQERLFAHEENREKIEYALIEEMVAKARRIGEVEQMSQLFPENPQLKKTFYKMLKGTNQYNREQGFPPLEHFFCVGKTNKAFSLSFASPLLLEALYGTEISLGMLKLEQDKWEESKKYYFFSKEDFQPFQLKFPAVTSLITAIDPYIDYSKRLTKREQAGARDPATGISVEKPY